MEGEQPMRAPDFWNLMDRFGAYMDDYQHAALPVPSTIPALDNVLKGGFRPGVHFIGGNTGAGKTALCLWMMERMAELDDVETGRKTGVEFISLELSESEVRARLGSQLSHRDDSLVEFAWADFEALGAKTDRGLSDGTYNPDEDPVYMADCALVARCPNVRIIDAIKNPRIQNITDICFEIEACGAHGGRVCFVDYLQCIEVAPGMDETEAMKDAVRELNLAGMRAGVAVIVIAAVNRAKGSEMRRGKDGDNPGADIFRGSSWIEYTGLTALALVRRDGATTSGDFTEVELHVVKNRRGTMGEPLHLGYCGKYGDFYCGSGDGR